jgi:predicted CXXCH cytochrome family protein
MRISSHQRRGFKWRGSVVPAATVAALLVGIACLAIAIRERQPAVAYAASPASPKMANPDQVCRSCHEKIYDSYERTPMAMGSGVAVDGLDDRELSAKNLTHASSGVTYRVSVRGGTAYLAYDRAATPHRYGLHGEQQLDYFIGSGRRGRTFLYKQDDLWFEAPINWYGKKQLWDMAPAYENATSMPDPLPVDPNCLHCHTGDAQPATGAARNHYPGAPFRAPGVGCASCHGDPAAHLAGIAAGKQGKPGTGPIVNPDKLDAVRRDGACIQCHLEGDAAVYRPGKSLAAFRPGENLSDSVLYFIDSSRAHLGQRATSQYEALLRSACKRASGDRMTCTTCHDPHSSPVPEERVAYFRAKCLGCHTAPEIATKHHPEQQDCAVCHMPTRKTLDISHEQLTDHDVEARPNAAPLMLTDLSAGDAGHRNGRELVLVAVGKVTAGDRELGLAYAQLAQHGDRGSGERALQLLQAAERAGADDVDVHDQLGFLLQVSGSAGAAAAEYVAALRLRPQDTTAAANLAVLDAASGQAAEAVRLLTQVVQDDPSQTAAGLNLAFLECSMGQKALALEKVNRMLVFNPDSAAAHRLLETGRYGNQQCSVR